MVTEQTTKEQVAESASEQSTAEPEQASPETATQTATTETEAASTPESEVAPEPQPETPSEPTPLTFESDDEVNAFIERTPGVKSLFTKAQNDARNEGKQAEERRNRQEVGRSANIAQLFESIRDVDSSDEKAKAIIGANMGYAATQWADEYPKVLLNSYEIPVEARETALAAREQGDWDGYVTTLSNAAIESEVTRRVAEERTKLAAEFETKLAGEMTARGLEAAPASSAPPNVPAGRSGSGGTLTAKQMKTMTDKELMARPREERDAALKAGQN